MKNCPRCTFKKWVLTNPLEKSEDGRRYFRCGRCGEKSLEDLPFVRVKPRNLYIDIEVGYAKVFTFDLRVPGEYIPHSHIEKERYIICWSAGWVGERHPIMSACVTPEAAIEYSDAEILPPLLALMEQADVISGHNFNKYDRKEINSRMAMNGIKPIMGYKVLDTLTEVRKDFRFMSNKLDYLARVFGFRPKMAMSDRDWLAITKGDEKTLRKMTRYNRGDVRTGIGVLESLYGLNGKPIDYYMRSLPNEPRNKQNE